MVEAACVVVACLACYEVCKTDGAMVCQAVPGILPIFLLAGVLRSIDSSKGYTLWFTYINPITYFFKM